jgi:GTPase SAR1 family protein
VGLNIGKIDIAGIRLNFWDLGGQEELQSLWDKVRFFYCIYFDLECHSNVR